MNYFSFSEIEAKTKGKGGYRDGVEAKGLDSLGDKKCCRIQTRLKWHRSRRDERCDKRCIRPV